jgi:hypothetical protein
METSDLQTFLQSQLWRASYVDNNIDDVIRYVSIENFKYQSDIEGPLSILLHTSVPYGVALLDKHYKEQEEVIVNDLISRLPKLFSYWPVSSRIQAWKTTYWRKSQVSKGVVDSGNCAYVNLGEDDLESGPSILFAADYFTESNFQGCFTSAKAAAEVAAEIIRKRIM